MIQGSFAGCLSYQTLQRDTVQSFLRQGWLTAGHLESGEVLCDDGK